MLTDMERVANFYSPAAMLDIYEAKFEEKRITIVVDWGWSHTVKVYEPDIDEPTCKFELYNKHYTGESLKNYIQRKLKEGVN